MRLFPDSHKSTVRLAAALIALTAVPLMGQSNVGFTLGLQSAAPATPYATYVANWKAATYSLFPKPAGWQNDAQVFAPGTKITWDTEVTVSGTQQSGAGTGQPVYGAANIVFDLELRDNGGVLVAGASVFLSDVNDGTGSDPLWSAAFPVGFNILNLGPGRATDEFTGIAPDGGPFMSVIPPSGATNPGDGTLLGMGCGYPQWIKSQTPLRTTQGVGMTTLPNGTTGTGVPGRGPVAEGQIDTTGFPDGTYTLSLIPGAGINVLRGDINLNADQNAFAVAADTTTPDSITFVIQGVPTCTGTVVGRHVYYENSFYDTPGIGCNNVINGGLPCTDDTAIASDKTAVLPGGPATTFANYISYSKGINGIMVDIARSGTCGAITAGDFIVTNTGRDGPGSVGIGPFADVPAVAPSSVTVRAGEGMGGSDRVVINWANVDGATAGPAFPNNKNAWLEVEILDLGNTGVEDLFWFGVAQGDGNIGNTVDAFPVSAGDQTATRDCATMGAGACGNQFTAPKPITEPLDYDRNGVISQAADFDVARNNPAVSSLTQALRAFTPPAP